MREGRGWESGCGVDGRTRPQGDGRPRSAAGAGPCGPPDRTCPPARLRLFLPCSSDPAAGRRLPRARAPAARRPLPSRVGTAGAGPAARGNAAEAGPAGRGWRRPWWGCASLRRGACPFSRSPSHPLLALPSFAFLYFSIISNLFSCDDFLVCLLFLQILIYFKLNESF